MNLQLYVDRGGKRLRCGYTTGSCAAGAAKAATLLLLGESAASVALDTPKGIALVLDVVSAALEKTPFEKATCAVRKDGGDDPDATCGMLVYATVSKIPQGIQIHGGEGIGRVTKPGLDQPVGAAAINSVPRRMISSACAQVCRQLGYSGGISVTISAPEGTQLAKRTFNPRLGIEGGISIIGTSGIVEPMSSAALVDTIRLDLNVLYASGRREVLLTPGNYGQEFARHTLLLDTSAQVTCSNFIGDAVDAAVARGFEKILLVGHIGKLVKLGIGMTNTHSAYGDGRMETLLACALEGGAKVEMLKAMLACVTTDAALETLKKGDALGQTMDALGRRISASLVRRAGDAEIGFVCFTNGEGLKGVLAKSQNASQLMELWRK